MLRSQVPRQLDTSPISSDIELPKGLVTLPESASGSSGLMKVCVRLYVAFSGSSSANDISIIVSTPSFVHAVPKNYIIKRVSARSTPVMIKLYMYVHRDQVASSLTCEILATYKSQAGEPRIANHTIELPLFLACALRPPTKAAAFKFTLDTGAAPVPLTEIFDDLTYALKEQGQSVGDVVGNTEAQAMGFQLWPSDYNSPQSAPAMVSILVSKTGGRYRVQSDCLPALHLFTSQLEKRLNAIMAAHSDEKVTAAQAARFVSKLRCDDKMTIEAYFEEISAHFRVRKQLQGFYSELNDGSHLFRVLQKRLLTRFKDRNASALGGLDLVMRQTYVCLYACVCVCLRFSLPLSLSHTHTHSHSHSHSHSRSQVPEPFAAGRRHTGGTGRAAAAPAQPGLCVQAARAAHRHAPANAGQRSQPAGDVPVPGPTAQHGQWRRWPGGHGLGGSRGVVTHVRVSVSVCACPFLAFTHTNPHSQHLHCTHLQVPAQDGAG